jgi:predicted phage terminase large subunit-like protein
MPPGTGKSTLGIFYMGWLMGRNPDMPNLASAYADKLCRSFYDGALSFITDPEYKYAEIFPDSPLSVTNAKDETIDLTKPHRFKSLTCRSIDGGLTGATRCESLLYADDMVSGSEEAMNRDRMDTLWTKFVNDLMSRMKQGCKMLIIGTRWSVWDCLGRLERQYEDNPRAKFVKIPALDINGKSNFEYKYNVGFSTEHFKILKDSMDDVSWRAIYMQEPIEREGVLYHEDDLMYFNGELPDGRPDAIVAVCDSKNQGKDYVSAPCGYVYGELTYIPAWVFNSGLPEVTKPLVAKMCVDHKVSRLDVEMNNGGDYYAADVDKQIHDLGGHTSIRTFFTSTNKITKIVTESDYVKKHFVFLDPKLPNTPQEYKEAMRNVFGFTITGKVKHEDAPDSASMLSILVKSLSGMAVQIIDRRKLPF